MDGRTAVGPEQRAAQGPCCGTRARPCLQQLCEVRAADGKGGEQQPHAVCGVQQSVVLCMSGGAEEEGHAALWGAAQVPTAHAWVMRVVCG